MPCPYCPSVHCYQRQAMVHPMDTEPVWSHNKCSCLLPQSCKELSNFSAKLLLKTDLLIGARLWNSDFSEVTEEEGYRVCKSTQISSVPMGSCTMGQGNLPMNVQFCFCSLQLRQHFNNLLTFSKHLSPATDRFWANCGTEKLLFWKHLKAVTKLMWQRVSIACSCCTKVCFLMTQPQMYLGYSSENCLKKRLILS